MFGLGHTVQMAMFILLTEAVVLWSTHLLHTPPVFATLTTSLRASILSLRQIPVSYRKMAHSLSPLSSNSHDLQIISVFPIRIRLYRVT